MAGLGLRLNLGLSDLPSVLRPIDAAGSRPQGFLSFLYGDFGMRSHPIIGQRPLCVLLVVYRLWASVRLAHLKEWFHSWIPDSVF